MQANCLAQTIGMSHMEWLDMRRKGIGGSDAGAILGVNKWKTPFQVYLEKVGELTETEAGEAAYFGNKLEQIVADEFEVRSGKKVRKINKILQHGEHEFMLANLDRNVVGENAFLECKTANQFLASHWEDKEVPASYLAQVQHYLAVTGMDKAYIAVLIGGNKFVYKEIERDQELIEMMIDAEETFWIEHVLPKRPPKLDGSSAAEKYVKEAFQEASTGKAIELTSGDAKSIDEYLRLKEQIGELTDQKKQIENNLKLEMADSEIAFAGNYELNWKGYSSKRVDQKKLKVEFPEIYKLVAKESSSRRFTIKGGNA